MSAHLQAEFMPARHVESSASPVDLDDLQEPHDAGGVDRSAGRCIGRVLSRAAAAAAVCLGVATLLGTGSQSATAFSLPVQVAATRSLSPTARHLQQSIHALESNGYVAKACTTKGMLMANPLTGRATMITY
jgi:hypothetical protein